MKDLFQLFGNEKHGETNKTTSMLASSSGSSSSSSSTPSPSSSSSTVSPVSASPAPSSLQLPLPSPNSTWQQFGGNLPRPNDNNHNAAAIHRTEEEDKSTKESAQDPENHHNVQEKDMDALLAQELNQMSLMERELVYEEIHGVDRHVEETPQIIAQALLAMEQILQQSSTARQQQQQEQQQQQRRNVSVPLEYQSAYDRECNVNRHYVQDVSFRLMFLRSENFCARDACHRLCYFLHEKYNLFGEQCLGRPVYLSDLNSNDQKVLKSGVYQLLPARDSTGRAVITDFHLIFEKCYKEPENLLRALSYIMMTACEDIETQKRGIVGVVYYVGKMKCEFNHPLNKRLAKFPKWLPYRLTGYHICFDDPRLRAWKPIAMLLMGRSLRVRLRIHDGTPTEVQYSLMTFGVPVDTLPITYQGELKTVNHCKWIQRRQVKETVLKKTSPTSMTLMTANRAESLRLVSTPPSPAVFLGIDLPGINDVILRRGRIFHDHPGNVRMRTLIDMFQPQYKSAPLGEKANIAAKIVKHIKEVYGGRFLERSNVDGGWWIEVSDKEAGKRVSKSIRSARTTKVAAAAAAVTAAGTVQPTKSYFDMRKDNKNTTAVTTTTTMAQGNDNTTAATASACSLTGQQKQQTGTSSSSTTTSTTSNFIQMDETHVQKRIKLMMTTNGNYSNSNNNSALSANNNDMSSLPCFTLPCFDNQQQSLTPSSSTNEYIHPSSFSNNSSSMYILNSIK